MEIPRFAANHRPNDRTANIDLFLAMNKLLPLFFFLIEINWNEISTISFLYKASEAANSAKKHRLLSDSGAENAGRI